MSSGHAHAHARPAVPSVKGESVFSEVVAWLISIPLFTRVVMLLSVGTYVIDHLIERSVYDTCLWPSRIIQSREVYRLFTYPFVHANVAHLFFNLVAFVPMGVVTEKAVGTIQMGHLVNFFALIAAIIEVALSYVVARLGYPIFYNTCSVGLSGVIFSFVVLSTTRFSTSKRHSIFGMFTVSKKYYPWALLLIFQLIFPSASFIGHASGIIVGYIYVYGLLDFTHVHNRLVNFVETARLLKVITHRQGFVMQPANGLPVPKTLVKGRPTGYVDDGVFASVRRFFSNFFRRSQGIPATGGRTLSASSTTPLPLPMQIVVQKDVDSDAVIAALVGMGYNKDDAALASRGGATLEEALATLTKKNREDVPARQEAEAHTA
eukprot:Opistho-2@53474